MLSLAPTNKRKPCFYVLRLIPYRNLRDPEECVAIMQQLFPLNNLPPGSIGSVGAVISYRILVLPLTPNSRAPSPQAADS
jgi:hypothetical protein